MISLNTYIVEDNAQTASKLKKYIQERSEFHLLGVSDNGTDAIRFLSDKKVDLILLDIHLPDMTGVEFYEKIKHGTGVIFVTAYDKYAVKAFELGAIDYLLKPFSKERFNKSLDRFKDLWLEKDGQPMATKKMAFSFKTGKQQFLFSYFDIIYISSHGKHSVIHTEDQDFEIPKLLKTISVNLPSEYFIKIHRRYIINKIYISRIEHIKSGQYLLYLKDNDSTPIPIGSSFYQDLKKCINENVL